MEILNDFMSGEELLLGFSSGTLIVFLATALISISIGMFASKLVFPIVMNLFSKTDRIDGGTLIAPNSLGWMIGAYAYSESMNYILLNLDPVWDTSLIETIVTYVYAGFVILMLIAAYRLVDYLDAFIVVEGEDMASRRSLASVAESVGRVIVVVLGAFVLAGLAGVPLAPIITGLGITGLALALAAKDSVANIFGAISILIDQPFNIGDWIIVKGVEGEVVNIGLRTTLVRTSADTMVTVPNARLVNSPVENFSKRRFRRIKPKFAFEEDSAPVALRQFCDRLLTSSNEDARTMKEGDSWVKIQSFGTAIVTVGGNFYCISSGSIQRELTEDILIMAREIAAELELKFHEPRVRSNL
ncbi:MAG: mechanosensitive ion channel family protein [Euryarchaeota archaeon]|jgi:MscS family membrane protein|nr:mechanosensitive ion channel family protein [Euryarchaeota archaeon]MBT6803029.1 mechanosensitive ion channel family protein [Euryarchaeota archaeon]